MNENYATKQQEERFRGAVTGIGTQAMGDCAAARQSAKGVLRDRIHRLRGEADRLEALAGALPEVLPNDADSALWDLLIKR